MLLLGCSSVENFPFGTDSSASSSSGTGGGKGCVSGQQVECACSGGAKGTQSCKSDGSGFEPCVCGSTGVGGAGTVGSGGQGGSNSSVGGQSAGGQGGGQDNVVQLSLGLAHTCALRASGSVLGWGWNDFGQCGTNKVQVLLPTPVAALSSVSEVALGDRHTCARRNDGSVSCWGRDADWQLGDGQMKDSATPISVMGLQSAAGIALGNRFSCALKTDGTVLCWGYNYYGQVGNTAACAGGSFGQKPTAVMGLTSVAQLAIGGGEHSCVRKSDGTVHCWGGNSSGQLGASSASSCSGVQFSSQPLAVSALTAVGAIAVGGHSCVLKLDSTVSCWGDNLFAQLGAVSNDTCNGTQPCSKTPIAVQGLSSVAQVSAGGAHTCARLKDGTVMCWGANQYGQLGAQSSDSCFNSTPCSKKPVSVPGLSSVVDIAVGGNHTCARKIDGGVLCWGWNEFGQLGDGTTQDRITPTLVKW